MKLGTTTIKTTSFYFYNGLRADDPAVTSEDAMTTSETYRGSLVAVDMNLLISRTFYTGDKGDSAKMNMWLHKTVLQKIADNGGNVHSNVPDTAKTAKAEQKKSPQLTDWRKWAGNLPPTNNAVNFFSLGARVNMAPSTSGRTFCGVHAPCPMT